MIALITCIVLLYDAQDSTKTNNPNVVATYGVFEDAKSLSLGTNDEIFVLDAKTSLVHKSSLSDNLHKSFSAKGWGNLEFDQPADVCASFPLDTYVADYNNRCVQQFDRKLNFIQSLTDQNLPSSYSGEFYPMACAISSQGELFIVETEGKRVLKFDQNHDVQKEFGSYSAGADNI